MGDKEQRTLGAVSRPQNQADIARNTSDKLAAARPRKVKVVAVTDGYDNIKLYKPGTHFTVSLKEKEELPLWVVTEEEWQRRLDELIEAEEGFNANDPGQVAALEEELGRAIWREKDEEAVERAKTAFEEKRRQSAFVGAGKQ